MNEPSIAPDMPITNAKPKNRKLPTLRSPFVCLLLFSLAAIVAAQPEKPYFFGVMHQLISTFLVTILFFGWWSFSRGFRFWEKLAGFVILIVEAGVTGKYAHHSVNYFTLWMAGLPLVASAIVAWLFLAKKFALYFVRF